MLKLEAMISKFVVVFSSRRRKRPTFFRSSAVGPFAIGLRHLFLLSLAGLILCSCATTRPLQDREVWFTDPEFQEMRPATIAVLPMDNMSFEPEASRILRQEVYKRVLAKGYQKIAGEEVDRVMKSLGISVPGQLASFSRQRIGKELNADAILMGKVYQSRATHRIVYDDVVVSCSLWLEDCKTGKELWRSQQWRVAHGQWQGDPLNAIINIIAHDKADRRERIAWLVQEMLKTLPQGPIDIDMADKNLLNQSTEVPVEQEE